LVGRLHQTVALSLLLTELASSACLQLSEREFPTNVRYCRMLSPIEQIEHGKGVAINGRVMGVPLRPAFLKCFCRKSAQYLPGHMNANHAVV